MTQSNAPINAGITEYASRRAESGDSGDRAVVTIRTPLSGTATQADRFAAIVDALHAAGLYAGNFEPVPMGVVMFKGKARDMGSEKVRTQSLTPLRMAVLQAFAKGLSYTQTAPVVGVSVEQVKAHTANLYRLFGVSGKIELVLAAVYHGIIPAPPAPAPATARRRSRTHASPDAPSA